MSEIYEHSQAALYGKGVFTTIAIRDGQPFLWDKHWRRLTENAARMGIDLSGFSGPGVRDRLNEALTGSAANGRARITFLDGSPSPVWPIDGVSEVSMHILTGSLRTVPDPRFVSVAQRTEANSQFCTWSLGQPLHLERGEFDVGVAVGQ